MYDDSLPCVPPRRIKSLVFVDSNNTFDQVSKATIAAPFPLKSSTTRGHSHPSSQTEEKEWWQRWRTLIVHFCFNLNCLVETIIKKRFYFQKSLQGILRLLSLPRVWHSWRSLYLNGRSLCSLFKSGPIALSSDPTRQMEESMQLNGHFWESVHKVSPLF